LCPHVSYTDPILVFFGTEIAYAPKQFFSARLRGFSGQKRMIFHFQPVRQKSCRIKPKLDQYSVSFHLKLQVGLAEA